MYLDAFGFLEAPFGVTPDPRFFFLGRTHEQALSTLGYGIGQRQGFVMVTGEVGTGKTLLCRALLERLGEKTSTALILNPRLEPLELLRAVLDDFGVSAASGDKPGMVEALNLFLLEKLRQGEHVVLILDEAQTLPDQSLEEIRLLSNLETDREKLLQIVLAGQPELLSRLEQRQFRQLKQRITVRCDLQPLAPREIRRYVAHRLRVASGRERPDIFTPAGLGAVSLLSRGYPRELNALCDRALLAAYAAGRARVGARLVYRAYRDLRKAPARQPRRGGALLRWGLPALLLLAAAGWYSLRQFPRESQRNDVAGLQAAPPVPTPTPAAVPGPPPPHPATALVTTPPASAVSPLPAPASTPAAPADDVSDGRSLSASLAALAQRWQLERLASEARQWQFVSLRERSLPAFFQKSGLARSHGMEILALPATAANLRAVNLPCLASEMSPEGYRFVLLAGLQGDSAVVLDPAAGRRVLPLPAWLANLRGSLFFLVPKGTLAPALRTGDRGPAVLEIQKALRRAGLLRGNPGGVFGRETREAVLTLQRKHGIAADGVAGLETRLLLLRLRGAPVPSLRGAS